MKATIPIGLPPRTKLLRLDRIENVGWRVWINQSPCGNLGTFLLLRNNGQIERYTMRDGEGDEVFTVKGSTDE